MLVEKLTEWFLYSFSIEHERVCQEWKKQKKTEPKQASKQTKIPKKPESRQLGKKQQEIESKSKLKPHGPTQECIHVIDENRQQRK